MYKELYNLSGLRMVEAAARLHSYSKAAQELHVTQAAVSQQIRQIEQQLGCKLFFRQGRNMLPTARGETLSLALKDGLDRMVAGIRAAQSEPRSGQLTLTTTPSFASMVLMPRMWKFASCCPDITLRIMSSFKLDNLRQGEVDLAIRFGFAEYPELNSVVLVDDDVVPLCSPRVAESLDVNDISSIKNSWLINYTSGDFWQRWFVKAGLAELIDGCNFMEVSNADVAISAVVAGQGICLGSATQAKYYIDNGLLIQPFSLSLSPGVRYTLLYDNDSPRKERISEFGRWLCEELDVQWPASSV